MILNKKKLKRYAIIALCSVIAILFILFLFRQSIFSSILNSKIESFNKNHQGTVSIKQAELTGLSNISIKGICLTPSTQDTLLTIDSMEADLKFWSIIFGNINFNSIDINNFKLSVHSNDSTDNFSFLFKRKKQTENDTLPDSSIVNYYSRSNLIFNAIFEHIPNEIKINDFGLFYKHNKDSVTLFSESIQLSEYFFKTVFHLNDGKNKSDIQMAGKIIPEERIASFKLIQPGKKNKVIPGLVNPYNASANFDTIFFSFLQGYNSDYIELIGKSYINHFKINQPSISRSDVIFDKLKFDFNIRIGENYFQLDSTSTAYFNELNFHPFFKITTSPTKQITFQIHKPNFPSQELFSSLPEGLFHTLYGIKTKGELAFNLDFFVDLSIPDSLKFSSELKKDHFQIQQFGNVNYSSIQNPFEYTAFEKDQAVRSFIVGPGNPNFYSLQQISPYIRNALLCTEDGAFFYHRGFIPESFQQSIIQNIKQKRFARGGSTISMQLVKNVFLKRNKTIARKLEEVIIVWLIENQGLCTKERMYEVYLNIIEWGPNIYGIGEASQFYFNKKPSELTLPEAIYLASIVPKPKYFKYCFEPNGELKTYVKDFILTISDKMAKKEMILPNEIQSIDVNVKITGQAKAFIIPTDSIPSENILDFQNP